MELPACMMYASARSKKGVPSMTGLSELDSKAVSHARAVADQLAQGAMLRLRPELGTARRTFVL